jgi:hypothetical protein
MLYTDVLMVKNMKNKIGITLCLLIFLFMFSGISEAQNFKIEKMVSKTTIKEGDVVDVTITITNYDSISHELVAYDSYPKFALVIGKEIDKYSLEAPLVWSFNLPSSETKILSYSLNFTNIPETLNDKYYVLSGVTVVDENKNSYHSDDLNLYLKSKQTAKCNYNFVCESNLGENYKNCPQDCPVKNPVCGNGICETDLGENYNNCPQDCPPKKQAPYWMYIITLLLVIAVIGFLIYRIKFVKVTQ